MKEVVYRLLVARQYSLFPSFAQQLLESVTFAKHIEGLDGSDEVINGPRIKGIA